MSSAGEIQGEGVRKAGFGSLWGDLPIPHLDPESVKHAPDIRTGCCAPSLLFSDCSCLGIQLLKLFQEPRLCHWCLQNCPG